MLLLEESNMIDEEFIKAAFFLIPSSFEQKTRYGNGRAWIVIEVCLKREKMLCELD